MGLAALPGGTLLVALPGNPLAACAGLLTLVQPLLRGLQGRPEPPTVPVRPRGELRSHPCATRLVPARSASRADAATGAPVVHPLPHTGSAMLRGLAAADVVLVVPPESAGTSAVVSALPLPWTSLPWSSPADDEGIRS
jgi:molybdopterin molybdotransferase